MLTVDFSFKRGEDLVVIGECETGNPADATLTVSKVKKLLPGRTSLRGDEVAVAEFAITLRPAAPPAPAGWNLKIPAATSKDMELGIYVFDILIEIAAGKEITQTIMFELEPSVSG